MANASTTSVATPLTDAARFAVGRRTFEIVSFAFPTIDAARLPLALSAMKLVTGLRRRVNG